MLFSSSRLCRLPLLWRLLVAPGVPKPNSSFSWRFTGTVSTESTPKGILKCRPGSSMELKRPNRKTTPWESGGTV